VVAQQRQAPVMKSADIELNDVSNDVTKPGATARYDDHVDADSAPANHATISTSPGETVAYHLHHRGV